MTFQSTVRNQFAFGVPGEIRYDGPLRAMARTISSTAVAANTVVGRAFTLLAADGEAVPGLSAAGAIFAGILAVPKVYAAQGTSAGGTLAPTMLLPPNSEGEFVTMGEICVQVATVCKEGDVVYFNNTTGVLTTTAPGDAAPASSTLIPNAVVWRVNQTVANGLVNIKLTQ